MDFINQMEPSFDRNETDALIDYMDKGGWGTEFKKTKEFAQMIADFTGAKYCVIMPNGTISLTAALLACGVGNQDEVIVPDYTMVATPNAVEIIGAKAVFVDIDRDTLCMDFDCMKQAITQRTKAIMLVTINGRYPSNMDDFVSFCQEKDIVLIEDAAQSLGSFCHGKHLGRFGILGSFSFSAPKIISTGQGGALITDDRKLYDRLLKIRDFGREESGSDHYLVKGWNFKFTDFQAVVGIEQMKKLPERIKRKKEMGRLYHNLLKDLDEIELIRTNYEDTCPWFFDILCNRRDGLKKYLQEYGIGSRKFYPALHGEPAYAYKGSYPIAEEISSKGLWLPSSIKLTDDQILFICDTIRNYYEREVN